MGVKVLQLIPDKSVTDLRAYSHCSGYAGGVTVLLINLSNTTAISVNEIVTKTVGDLLALGSRQEYVFSSSEAASGDEIKILQSKKVLLNGVLLQVDSDFTVPMLSPVVISDDRPLIMAPLTYGFFVFPDAGLSVCQD